MATGKSISKQQLSLQDPTASARGNYGILLGIYYKIAINYKIINWCVVMLLLSESYHESPELPAIQFITEIWWKLIKLERDELWLHLLHSELRLLAQNHIIYLNFVYKDLNLKFICWCS